MTKFWAVLLGAALSLTAPVAQSQTDARQTLIERAKSLELNTPYVPPPGDPMEHYADLSIMWGIGAGLMAIIVAVRGSFGFLWKDF